METKCSLVHCVSEFVSFSHCLCVSCAVKMPGLSLQRAIIPLCFSSPCLVLFTISGHRGVPPFYKQQINMYNICIVFHGESAMLSKLILFYLRDI